MLIRVRGYQREERHYSMAYDEFKKFLGDSGDVVEGLRGGIKVTDVDFNVLVNIKDGVINQILLPSKRTMSTYIGARQSFLNLSEPTVDYNGSSVRQYAWRSPLSHTYGLCAQSYKDAVTYGNSLTGAGTLDRWVIERWRQYMFKLSTQAWVLCSEYVNVTESFANVSTDKITEVNLSSSLTVNSILSAVSEWDTGMKWLYTTPISGVGEPKWQHDYGSYGVYFMIDANRGAIPVLQHLLTFYTQVSSLNDRYSA